MNWEPCRPVPPSPTCIDLTQLLSLVFKLCFIFIPRALGLNLGDLWVMSYHLLSGWWAASLNSQVHIFVPTLLSGVPLAHYSRVWGHDKSSLIKGKPYYDSGFRFFFFSFLPAPVYWNANSRHTYSLWCLQKTFWCSGLWTSRPARGFSFHQREPLSPSSSTVAIRGLTDISR